MIPQKTVEEILETAKVEEVIQDFVNLKRRGVNLIGLCPFHNEKTPSFTVSPSKGIYKCFGCGNGGNAVQFLMEHEQLTYPEALRWLANKFGIHIEEIETSQEAKEEKQLLDSLYIVNQFAKDFFQDQLFNTDVGKSVGLSYFKERGFKEETIKKFDLGFAPNIKDALTRKATQAGYNLELLKKLGLTSKYDSDFFRNRVQFTIHNLSGKVIGFGGRTLQKDKKIPKYINSPETEIYNKSKVLYGTYFAKRPIRKEDECILVEGYTDVISLHQAGIENVVASSGTSLTVGQIQLIKRYTPNIKILYDGDYAGIKAALRGLDLVLEQDLNVKVVLLPEGEDPDSYLQSVGVEAFKEFITSQAEDFILFKVNLLLKDAGNDPVKKANIIKDIVQSISKIPDPIKRSLYVRECARLVEVEEQILVNESNKLVTRNYKKARQKEELKQIEPEQGQESRGVPPRAKPQKQDNTLGDEFQERDIVRILITGGSQVFNKEDQTTIAEYVLANILDVLEDFDNKLFEKIARLTLDRINEGEELSPTYFINHPEEQVRKLSIDLISSPYEYSENWEKKWDIFLQSQKMPELNFSNDSIQSLRRFKLRKIMRMCEKNQSAIKEFAAQGNTEQMFTHMKVQQRLIDIRNELAALLGTVILK